MGENKINLCCAGDPRSPKTWSGTPFNLITELERRNQLADAFSIDIDPKKARLLTLLDLATYGTTDKGRAKRRRMACAKNVAERTTLSSSKNTLHLTSLSLPFAKKPDNQKHYLFCDSTWNLWSSNSTDMGAYSDKQVRLFDELERKAYQQADHLFPIAEYVKQNLIDHYGISASKITPVGTGMGIIQPYHGEKDYANKRILFTAKGRFRDKGGDLVIAAFQEARKIDPDLQLTIVGSEAGLSFGNLENVTVLGFIPLPNLQELFNTHSLFVMPALNEPWGLVFVEAMICKMPLLGLNRNSFPELSGYGKYGEILDEPNPILLGKAMARAFADLPKLAEIGQNAQTHSLSYYTWENTVSRMLNVIFGEKSDV